MRLFALAVAFGAALLSPTASAQTPCVNGFAGEYPCLDVDLLAQVTIQQLGGPAPGDRQCGPTNAPNEDCGNDIWGWTDPITGREYALVGLFDRTTIVDVTVPTTPAVIGFVRSAVLPNTTGRVWRDVKTLGNSLVVVSELAGHGLQVFDLTRVRGLTADRDREFSADARYTGIGSAHNVAVNEATGFAYAVGSVPTAGLPEACNARGFHAINLQNPLNPTFAGCFSDAAQDVSRIPGYTHDAQCVTYDGPDTDYTGREICFGANENVVAVFDATDKANVVLVSQVAYPATAYTHQGWLTEDGRYFVTNDELDEANGLTATQRTIILNVEDLDDPEFSFTYDSGLPVIDHNLYVRGRYAFESNYAAGLRIVDLQEIENGQLTEVAYFDTQPATQRVAFDGMWSNYPYFESGVVVASDQNRGLFVLQPAVTRVTASEPLPAGVAFELAAARPNPFGSETRLRLQVAADQDVTAVLLDVTGREVSRLFSGPVQASRPVPLVVEAEALPAGVYIVRVTGETFEASQPVVLTR